MKKIYLLFIFSTLYWMGLFAQAKVELKINPLLFVENSSPTLVYERTFGKHLAWVLAWGDQYEARTDANDLTKLKGYFQLLGIEDQPHSFELPSVSSNQPLKVYTGKLNEAIKQDHCGSYYEIGANIISAAPPQGFTTKPSGLLINNLNAAGLGGAPKRLNTYSICRSDAAALASSINKYSSEGQLEVYMWKPQNSLNPGLYYKIQTDQGKAQIFVAEDPGAMVDGDNEGGRRFYQFNCALGIWEEVSGLELTDLLSKMEHLNLLWKIFKKRTEVHTALTIAGFVPFVGGLADITNGFLYIREGQVVQGGIEIFIGTLSLGIDVAEVGSLFKAGLHGAKGGLIKSIWKVVNCPTLTPIRQEKPQPRSINLAACDVEEILGQAAAKLFNDNIDAVVKAIGGDILPKIEGSFNAFVKSDKGEAFLKWLNNNPDLIPDVTKIIANAFGKWDFTVTDFIKLSDDLIANPSLVAKLAGSSQNLEWWLKLLRAGKTSSRLSSKVYEQISKLPDGILDDLLYYSDESFKEFMDIADDALIAELIDNPDLVKGLVSHKNAAYLSYFDNAVDYVNEILETPAGVKLLEWLNYSRETGAFLSRMAEAKRFADGILDNFRSFYGEVQEEVTFIVRYAGREYRTRLDGITIVDGKFVAIECKMGNAVLSKNQEAFFNALKNGGEIIPVGGNAEEIFGPANVNQNVRDQFAAYWFKNSTKTGL